MSNIDTNIEQIRAEANKLHQQLDTARAENEAAMRKASAEAAVKAQELASKLRSEAQAQRSDTSARLANAAASLESAAASAKTSMAAKQDEMRALSLETLHHVRAALQDVSQGVAAKAAQLKQRAEESRS